MARVHSLGEASPKTTRVPQFSIQQAEQFALLGRGALNEISALCTLALAAMECPGTWESEDLALCLQSIRSKATDVANCIDAEAEAIGMDVGCPREKARRDARFALFQVKTLVD